MVTLTVGVDQEFSTLSAAIAASANGDLIEVQAGTYTNDFAEIDTQITIEGVGGTVDLVATEPPPNQKAILTTDTNVTIENVSFSGATISSDDGGNAAGIRYQGGSLTLIDDDFHNNQDGILGAADPTGDIAIENSTFEDNGSGTGSTHDIYIGDIAGFTLTGSTVASAVVGNDVKSRAETNIISGNTIEDGPTGTSSYEIDLPDGGNDLVTNNVIEKGLEANNEAMVHFGGETPIYANSTLTVSDNTFINDYGPNAVGVLVQTTAPFIVTGNTLDGLSPSRLVADDAVPCFCAGTRIATEQGERAVETLQIGDRIVTHTGAVRAIRWIGHRAYDGRFVAGNRKVLPIVICAGALADGIPARDLAVSPKHAMFLDGILIPAECLVNGASIVQEDAVADLRYFHLELDSHDILLAEGAPAESFVDRSSRAMFHNAAAFFASHPDAAIQEDYAPRLEDGELVETVRARIAARAEPASPGKLEGFIDICDARTVEGWALDLTCPRIPVRLELLDGARVIARICADRFRDDLDAAGKGDGRCSFVFRFNAASAPRDPRRVRVRRASDRAELVSTVASNMAV